MLHGITANTGKEQAVGKHSQYFKDIYSVGHLIWLFFMTVITRKLSLKCEGCLGQRVQLRKTSVLQAAIAFQCCFM